jgi:hypothetical protein
MPHGSSGDYFVVSFASGRFGFSAIEARSTIQECEWPITEFIVHKNKERQRVVRAMRDDPRWEFYAEGEALPFEKEEAYSAKRIRDRFQREALLSYIESWGAPVKNPLFWQTEASAVTFVSEDSANKPLKERRGKSHAL